MRYYEQIYVEVVGTSALNVTLNYVRVLHQSKCRPDEY